MKIVQNCPDWFDYRLSLAPQKNQWQGVKSGERAAKKWVDSFITL